jgi:predicted nucleic acid-binding protein
MIVVGDSGPLHYLILLNQVELLRRLYGRVVIPDAVSDELRAPGSPSEVSDWAAHPPEWVAVAPVSQEQLAAVTNDLDLGERAAIALAEAIEADLLLIDERAGRAEARRRNLLVTGTLGVLRAGAEQGAMDVPDMLGRLRATSFYADEALIQEVFAQWLQR